MIATLSRADQQSPRLIFFALRMCSQCNDGDEATAREQQEPILPSRRGRAPCVRSWAQKTDGTASGSIACRIADKKTGQRWAIGRVGGHCPWPLTHRRPFLPGSLATGRHDVYIPVLDPPLVFKAWQISQCSSPSTSYASHPRPDPARNDAADRNGSASHAGEPPWEHAVDHRLAQPGPVFLIA